MIGRIDWHPSTIHNTLSQTYMLKNHKRETKRETKKKKKKKKKKEEEEEEATGTNRQERSGIIDAYACSVWPQGGGRGN